MGRSSGQVPTRVWKPGSFLPTFPGSPTFLKPDPNARDLLGVTAFFPQGVNENHLDWLFPMHSLSNIKSILYKFCALSSTRRSYDYTTMLAPIRDHLFPRIHRRPLAAEGRHFSWLVVCVIPGDPRFEETRWILSEDANVEHLFSTFASLDKNPNRV